MYAHAFVYAYVYLYERKTISIIINSFGIAGTPMCWSDSADRQGEREVGWMRERHTCLEGGNYAASAASPHYPASATSVSSSFSTSDLPHSLRSEGEARGGLVGRGLGRAGDEAKGCRGMGGHSIDFVQDSRRRRRRRRGQPDPPLVVPTRLQHRPPPHIPPRLVSYSFSFEHTTARPRAPLVPLVLSLAFSSLSLSVPFPLCLSSNLRYPLAVSYSHRALDKMLRKPHTSTKYPLRRAVLSICTGIKRIVYSIRGPRITRTTRDFDNALVILITYSRQSLF